MISYSFYKFNSAAQNRYRYEFVETTPNRIYTFSRNNGLSPVKHSEDKPIHNNYLRVFQCVTYLFYGVMVSTLDFESSDPSSNLGRTLELFFVFLLAFFSPDFTVKSQHA